MVDFLNKVRDHRHSGIESPRVFGKDLDGFEIRTTVPTGEAREGTFVLVDDASSIRRLYVRINNTWRFVDWITNTIIPSKFAGDSSDGSKTVSGDESLDFNNANVLIKNYSDLTIDVTKTLSATNVPSDGGVMYLKVFGDCTINGTIDMSGEGGDLGAAKADGTGGYRTTLFDASDHFGGQGGTATDGSGGGGGGGGHQTIGDVGIVGTGTTPGAAGTAGAALVAYAEHIDQNLKALFFACGSGGGGGGDGAGVGPGEGGPGANGGGIVVIEVGGDLTFGASSTITVAGNDGSAGENSVNNGGGGGGGGSGGQIYVLYNGTLTDGGVTATVSGGAKGKGGTGGADNGGDGGDGGAGDSYIVKNIVF